MGKLFEVAVKQALKIFTNPTTVKTIAKAAQTVMEHASKMPRR